MGSTIWSATLTLIGEDAGMMLEGGVIILFGEPVPSALADISLVHAGAEGLAREIKPGDLFQLGTAVFTIDEVGERAQANLAELGHAVVYVNQPGQNLLPGAIKATGGAIPTPAVGDTVAFAEAD